MMVRLDDLFLTKPETLLILVPFCLSANPLTNDYPKDYSATT